MLSQTELVERCNYIRRTNVDWYLDKTPQELERILEGMELYQKEITRLEIENEKWRLLHRDEDDETSEDYTSEEETESQEAGTTLGEDLNESPEDYKVYEKCVELYESTRGEMQATFN